MARKKTTSTRTTPHVRKPSPSHAQRKRPREELIADFMTRSPHTIGNDQALERARKMMNQYRIRHLPVLDGGRLVGLVSQRDVYFVEALDIPGDKSEITVDEAMSRDVFEVGPRTPVAQVVEAMVRKKFGCAVVTDSGRVVGVFSTIDAMALLLRYLR